MSENPWIKVNLASRAWRRAPLTTLIEWREMSDAPLLFKMKRAHYLLCRGDEARQLTRGQRVAVQSHSAVIDALNLLASPEWLPSLQRFLGISLTTLLERDQLERFTPERLIGEPLTAALVHHLFGIDLKRTHLESVTLSLELIDRLELTLKGPESRLIGEGSISRWQQRSLRKLYRQITPHIQRWCNSRGPAHHALLTPERGISTLWHLLELKRQLTESVSWLFTHLAHRDHLYEAIFNELTAHLKSSAYRPEDLSQLPTLHTIALETLRQAPPHWVTQWGEAHAVIHQDTYLERFSQLPPATRLITSPFLDHRDNREWPSALSFTPERFIPTAHGAPLPHTLNPLGADPLASRRFEIALNTIIATTASLARRGQLEVSSVDGELEQRLKLGEVTPMEHQTGVGIGSPMITMRFIMNERYIYIPSARV